jgi:CHASE3 domain sensor protein
MNHSSKPGMSFNVGVNELHGVARFDQIRNDTLVQLVQHWAEPKDRDAIIDALDELAAVVCGVAREGELDAAVEQVEDAAGMDTAQVTVGMHDVRRLLAELAEVERRTSRFAVKGAAEIKHPAMLPTRRHLKANPLPEQTDRRWTA